MSEYALVEPFDFDDPAFALGVEWAMFRARLLKGDPFATLCLSDNAERLCAMVERHGRFCEWSHLCEGWARIVVGDFKES